MESAVPLPSNRSFGTVFVVFFFLVGTLIWWKGGRVYPWFFGASGLVLMVTLSIPRVLTPFNKAWMRLAEVLNRIVSPIVMGVIFFGLITPMALIMRMAGRDSMNRKFDRDVSSYWIRRDPPGPDPTGLPNQF